MRFFKLYCATFCFAVIVLMIGVFSAYNKVPQSDKIIYVSMGVIVLVIKAVVSTTDQKPKPPGKKAAE